MDILMLGWFLGPTSVGIYRSIQPVAKMLIFLLQALTFIYLPIATRYFQKEAFDELDSIYKTSTRWISLLTFPLFIYLVVFGKPLISTLFTPDYASAWVALGILSVGMYSRVFAGPNGMTVKAINRTREDLFASVGGVVTNFVLNILLIPEFGISGAALATACGFFVYNIIDLFIIHNYTGVHPFHWDLVTPMVPTILIVVTLAQFVSASEYSLVQLVLLGIFISLIHLVSILSTSGLTTEDKQLLSEIRSKLN